MNRILMVTSIFALTVCLLTASHAQTPITDAAIAYDQVVKTPLKYVGKRVAWVGWVTGSWFVGDVNGWYYLLENEASDGKSYFFSVVEPSKSTDAAKKMGFGFRRTFLVTGTVKEVADTEILTSSTTRETFKVPVLIDATLDVPPGKR